MFSQPTIKRISGTQHYMPMQQIQPNIPIYNPNQQLEFPNSYQTMNMNMNDNMSYYSSASTATNLTNNLKKKNFLEEFNTILNNCMTTLLPKIAEECADLVFSKISSELDKQSKEIESMKSQLSQFEEIIKEKLNFKIFNIDSTPYKNLRQANGELSELNSLMVDQSYLLRDLKLNGNQNKINDNNYQNIFDCLNKKISSLKDEIDEERKMADKMNMGIKDRYVDLLGIKNIIDDKINYLINDLKFKSSYDIRTYESSHDPNSNQSETKIYEMISMVDSLYEKIHIHSQNNRREFSNLEIQNNHREKMIVESSCKSNPVFYNPPITPTNQKMHTSQNQNMPTTNYFSSMTNYNYNANANTITSTNSITSPGIIENSKSSNKGKNSAFNSTSSRKQNKRINISHKFTF